MADVLIIDDNSMLCKTLTRHIDRLGHRVVAAHSLEQGLGKLSSGGFDIVLLDVNLPDGSGLDVLPARP